MFFYEKKPEAMSLSFKIGGLMGLLIALVVGGAWAVSVGCIVATGAGEDPDEPHFPNTGGYGGI